jgi:hypothetical protein
MSSCGFCGAYVTPVFAISLSNHHVTPLYAYAGTENRRKCSSYHSQPRWWNEVGGQHDAPAASPLVKTRYSLYGKLGGPRRLSGLAQNNSSPPGLNPRTVQPVASCYIIWAAV